MTTEDEPEETLDDDERARRAAAAELQEQIDALVRGEVENPAARPQSLRDFIEQREKRPVPEASHTPEQSSSDEGQEGEASRESEG